MTVDAAILGLALVALALLCARMVAHERRTTPPHPSTTSVAVAAVAAVAIAALVVRLAVLTG